MSVCMSIHIYSHVHTYTRVHTVQCTYTRVHSHVHTHVYTHPYTCLYKCSHTCLYTCPYTCLYTCPYTCLYVCPYSWRRLNFVPGMSKKQFWSAIARALGRKWRQSRDLLRNSETHAPATFCSRTFPNKSCRSKFEVSPSCRASQNMLIKNKYPSIDSSQIALKLSKLRRRKFLSGLSRCLRLKVLAEHSTRHGGAANPNSRNMCN